MRKEIETYLLSLILVLAICCFCQSGCNLGKKSSSPQEGKEPDGKKILYERNLKKLVSEGYYVLVDKDEKDIFIQEDLYSTDYGTLIELARIKSEAMGVPLYTEDFGTLGKNDYLEEIRPMDRKAYQDLAILESQLLDPSFFKKGTYLDESSNRNRAEYMDKKRTVPEMLNFIDRYPDSVMVSRAISYIEYQLCAFRRNPDEAIKVYKQIKEKYKDKPRLLEILDEYIKRAIEYKEKYGTG